MGIGNSQMSQGNDILIYWEYQQTFQLATFANTNKKRLHLIFTVKYANIHILIKEKT